VQAPQRLYYRWQWLELALFYDEVFFEIMLMVFQATFDDGNGGAWSGGCERP